MWVPSACFFSSIGLRSRGQTAGPFSELRVRLRGESTVSFRIAGLLSNNCMSVGKVAGGGRTR